MRSFGSFLASNTLMASKFKTGGLYLALCSAGALAQLPQKPSAALPATQPTSLATPAAYTAPAPPPVQAPTILFQDGLLTIRTENSSLNQTLREVARRTGMHITGGVSEERVFGTYGPAKPGDVLRTLLAGTSSNMLYQDATATQPAQLTLTARQGTATPPSVFSANQPNDDENDSSASQPSQPSPNEAVRPTLPPQQPGYNLGSFGAPVQQDGNSQAAPATNTDSSGQPQSPNGVKTPEQLLQQLMQLRQNGK